MNVPMQVASVIAGKQRSLLAVNNSYVRNAHIYIQKNSLRSCYYCFIHKEVISE